MAQNPNNFEWLGRRGRSRSTEWGGPATHRVETCAAGTLPYLPQVTGISRLGTSGTPEAARCLGSGATARVEASHEPVERRLVAPRRPAVLPVQPAVELGLERKDVPAGKVAADAGKGALRQVAWANGQ